MRTCNSETREERNRGPGWLGQPAQVYNFYTQMRKVEPPSQVRCTAPPPRHHAGTWVAGRQTLLPALVLQASTDHSPAQQWTN